MRCLALAACVSIALAVGCAKPRPVLYPNDTLERVGGAQAQLDVENCLERAERDVGDSRESGGADAAKRTAENSAVGAATGAAVGGVLSGRSAAEGAAAGAVGAATSTALRAILHPGRGGQPDPVFRRYVERCLQDQGYDVIGWRKPA